MILLSHQKNEIKITSQKRHPVIAIFTQIVV